MAEAEEKQEASHDSRQRNTYPGDLLQRFISGGYFPGRLDGVADEEEEEEVELSLGLSLNGRFGVDPKRTKKLSRSSSISDFVLTNGNKNAACLAPPAAYAPLIRTCSLPTETEEEWRKRKEIQTLRRMAAKRKRLEKLKNVRTVRDQVSLEANYEENSQSQSQGSVINGRSEFLLNPASWVSGVTQQGSGHSGSGSSESENQPTQGIKFFFLFFFFFFE